MALFDFVQVKHATNTSSPVSATFDSAVTTGNFIVVAVTSTNTGGDTISLADTQSNSYTNKVFADNGGGNVFEACALNVTGGSGFQVTATDSDTTTKLDLSILEFVGDSSVQFDTGIGHYLTGVDSYDTGTITMSAAGLAVGYVIAQGSGVTVGTGFTERDPVWEDGFFRLRSDSKLAGPGSVSYTGVYGSNLFNDAIIIAFVSGGGGGPVIPIFMNQYRQRRN